MWLTLTAVRRPLAVIAVYAAIAIAGLIAYVSLPINLFPAVDIPVVTVATVYPGAGPEEVELQVTRIIESAVAGLNNLDYVTSVSREGSSSVTLVFTDKANSDLIGTEVERQVSGIVGRLPDDATQPQVLKVDFSQLPVMQVGVIGDSLPPEELFRVADDVLRPEFEQLSGVSQVEVIGGRDREVRVTVDPTRLTAVGLSLTQVQGALVQANATTPGGSIADPNVGRSYSLRVTGAFAQPEDLSRVVVGGTREAPVRLQDVATVEVVAREPTQYSRVNGKQAVVLQVGLQSGANTTDVADAVQRALPRLRASAPGGAELVVIQDNSVGIRESLLGVQEELILAIVLTSVVLLLFLHSFRVSLIVLVSIPTTLLATLVAMQLLGFSFNVLSTLGLTLTIGILVDDSIVVLENILRHLARGEPPAEAAVNGRAEIGLAALAITLVDVVIFAPVGLVSGQIGGFFREFGFTIAAATLFSLVVSFTLTPMLASRMIREDPHKASGGGPLGAFGRWWDRGFEGLEHGYQWLLRWCLRLPLLVIAGAFASIVGGFMLIATGAVPIEFFPRTDEGFFTVSTEAAPGTSLESHNAAMRIVEERLIAMPEVLTVTASVGVTASGGFGAGTSGQARFGTVTVEVQPKETHRRDIHLIQDEARAMLQDIPGLTVRVQAVSGGGGSGQPVQVRLQGANPRVLEGLARQVESAFEASPLLRDVTNTAAAGQPELRIQVDRARAADLGISAVALGQAVRSAYSGAVATKYRQPDGRELDVRIILTESARVRPDGLIDLPIQTTNGGIVRLGQVATIVEATGPTQIDRRDRERTITVTANLQEGVSLGEATVAAQAALATVPIPNGYNAVFGGDVEEQNEAFGQLFLALGVSILLTYLLMAVLYNSLFQPLIILFSLPVAIGGAIAGLAVFRYSFNLFSMIGLILLVGLAIKNGILLVDRTNQNRHRGLTLREALLEAGPARLRPILMTSIAIAIAMLPSALQVGEAAELRAPLAATVFGGVVSSTLLTLVLIPAMYVVLEGAGRAVGRVIRRSRTIRLPRRPATRAAPPRAA